jgi:hypothetical protein
VTYRFPAMSPCSTCGRENVEGSRACLACGRAPVVASHAGDRRIHTLGPAQWTLAALALLLLMLACGGGARSPGGALPAPTIAATELTDGWALQAANEVTDPGATIATVGYATTGWHPVTLPSTVLAGLVADGV